MPQARLPTDTSGHNGPTCSDGRSSSGSSSGSGGNGSGNGTNKRHTYAGHWNVRSTFQISYPSRTARDRWGGVKGRNTVTTLAVLGETHH